MKKMTVVMYRTGIRCIGKTEDGDQCANFALKDKNICRHHRPEAIAARRAARLARIAERQARVSA